MRLVPNRVTAGVPLSGSLYLIRTDDRPPAYVRMFDGRLYVWTYRRSEAARWERESAVENARRLAEAVGRNGYPGVRVSVVPASGGAAVGQSFVS
jgi:hypothetical protein